MSMIYGAAGALLVLALLAIGAFAGWTARAKFYQAKAESPAEEELRRMQEEQEAFRLMQNYNADVAYGIAAELERSESA